MIHSYDVFGRSEDEVIDLAAIRYSGRCLFVLFTWFRVSRFVLSSFKGDDPIRLQHQLLNT